LQDASDAVVQYVTQCITDDRRGGFGYPQTIAKSMPHQIQQLCGVNHKPMCHLRVGEITVDTHCRCQRRRPHPGLGTLQPEQQGLNGKSGIERVYRTGVRRIDHG